MPELEGKTKEKDVEKPEKVNKRSRSFLNKVVIRKLPPNLNFESFIEIVSPLPDYFDLYFVSADWSLGAEATSRAYIEFKNEEDIFMFRDKFDSYVFVDSVRGSEYPAIVEYASFQGLPKSRSRKKDKNVGTIETEQHYLDFLEQLKKEEEADAKTEPKLEFSYQIKDDKKIKITPLIEFLAAKNREKRDAKRKKSDDKRKQQQDDKQKKKIQIAKNIPEVIKEAREEVLYEDGIMVRTVPSRSGRSDKKKDSKSDGRSEAKPKSENSEKLANEKNKEKRREKEKAEQKKFNQEKEEKRKADRAAKRQKQMTQKESETKTTTEGSEQLEKPDKPKSEHKNESKQTNRDRNKDREAPVKNETKRYSALRKARQEKTSESKDAPSETYQEQGEEKVKQAQTSSAEKIDVKKPELSDEQMKADAAKKEAQKEARLKKAQENKERRAREADERAQRQIRNRDRPSMQIYQPKRRNENVGGSENKSSDENSETSRKKSDNEVKKSDTERKPERRERRQDKRSSRKNSRDETRKKKTSRSEDDVEKLGGDANSVVADGTEGNESIVEKLGNLALKASKPKIVRGNVSTLPPAAPKEVPAAEDAPTNPLD